MPAVSVERERVLEQSGGERAAIWTRWLSWAQAHAYGITAGVLIGVAFVLRLLLTLQGWPTLNSDEATTGLTALHIAFRGEHPIFFYGESYMGALEAYLAAPLFKLFGVSLLTLRLGLLVMFSVFLASMYGLISLLYSKRAALISLIVLGSGAVEILFHELEAAGGYPETVLFGGAVLFLAVWLALTSAASSFTSRFWRAAAYLGWGLAAGLGIWSDPLVLPFVAMGGVVLGLFRWRELLRWGGPLLLAGLVIGALPLIIYNITALPGQSTWDAIQQTQKTVPVGVNLSYRLRLAGTMLISLPNATGVTPLCSIAPDAAWPFSWHASPQAIHCMQVRAAWSLGFLSLWTASVLLAIWGLWRVWRGSAAVEWAGGRRHAAVIYAGRLAVLGSAGLTIALYARSPVAAATPWPSGRYLFAVIIAIPAVMSPLLNVTTGIARATKWRSLVWRSLRYGAIMFICLVFLAGTYKTFASVGGSIEQAHQEQQGLVNDLLRLGATRIYSDYWTCNVLILVSQERIICSVVNGDLSPGVDRYAPYRAIVQAAKHPTYVFPLDSPQSTAFAHGAVHSGTLYQQLVMDGYVMYRPRSS